MHGNCPGFMTSRTASSSTATPSTWTCGSKASSPYRGTSELIGASTSARGQRQIRARPLDHRVSGLRPVSLRSPSAVGDVCERVSLRSAPVAADACIRSWFRAPDGEYRSVGTGWQRIHSGLWLIVVSVSWWARLVLVDRGVVVRVLLCTGVRSGRSEP